VNTVVRFAKGFYLDGVAQYTHRPAPKPIWVNRAPSEVAAPGGTVTHPRPVRNHPKQKLN